MSYYTNYNIQIAKIINDNFDYPNTIIDPPQSLRDALDAVLPSEIEEITPYEYEGLATWYDHESVLAKISCNHPDWLFTINGIGEDSDDRWTTYIYNGLSQTHIIRPVIPPIDPNKWSMPIPSIDDIKDTLQDYDIRSPEYTKLELLVSLLKIRTHQNFQISQENHPLEPSAVYKTVTSVNEPRYVIPTKDHYNFLKACDRMSITNEIDLITPIINQIIKDYNRHMH